MKYQCTLEVLAEGKSIPYGKGVRADGAINHGFTPLKGRLDDILRIPEASEDSALACLLKRLNERDTALFTVGCLSAPLADEYGHRRSGYVEISLNSRSLVSEPVNYFVLFWHFSRYMLDKAFTEPVMLDWQFLGAAFVDKACEGFTCRIIMNTDYHETSEEAYACWARTLDSVGEALTCQEVMVADVIY